ncbi:MAG TPA: peptidase inhibitor family I36 protein [Streptosporangiaceae bacterium]|jgi:hypothetical protein
MNIVSRTATALAVAASTVAVLAAAAPAASAKPSAAAADGYVYASDLPRMDGEYCAWSGSDPDWADCKDRDGRLHTMLNRAGSLSNRGYAATNDDVNFYWGKGYTGSWACLGQGDSWLNLPAEGHTFTWGVGRRGYRDKINNNIASHKWVSYCGSN